MSKLFAANLNFYVNFLSDSLGFSPPEGWLCTKTIAVAECSKASFSTIRTSTIVLVMPPLLNCVFAKILFELLSYKTQNSS